MENVNLKLKQASALLGVSPKDLQNLVQMGVVRPVRRRNICWFDANVLLTAKVAFYLKDSLGSSSDLLARFTQACSQSLKSEPGNWTDICLRSRPANGTDAVEIIIPVRSLAQELESKLPAAAAVKDLPKGRKRAGWKRELLRNMQQAAADLSNVSEEQILKSVREHRTARKKRPEISVIAITKEKTA
ncbi:MAG TPA: hypothetical protein VFR84_01060 [Candidatus Angelobacter sp.]|nr:hypothetical protein [Candidatus Angelobacter sp.]